MGLVAILPLNGLALEALLAAPALYVDILEGLVWGCIMLLATQRPFPTLSMLPHNCSPAPRRAAGLGRPTHPQDVDPVVVGAEIHAELDQELAYLQDRELLLA